MNTLLSILLAPIMGFYIPSASQGEPVYIPSNTTVAILPVGNTSAERDPNFKTAQCKAAFDELRKEFAERGFKVLDDAAVSSAIASCKVDVNDVEQQSKDMVINVGQAANAGLAVFVVIDKVYSKLNRHFFDTQTEGHGRIMVWLDDVKQHLPLLNAAVFEGKHAVSDYIAVGMQGKRSEQVQVACAEAVKLALTKQLKTYPTQKKN